MLIFFVLITFSKLKKKKMLTVSSGPHKEHVRRPLAIAKIISELSEPRALNLEGGVEGPRRDVADDCDDSAGLELRAISKGND